MKHLTDISVEDLQNALDAVEGKKPTQRLLAAIAYKNGITQTELAEWYGVERRTIYSWLTRLENQPLEQAVYDEHRPGRPRKLSADEQAAFEAALHESPVDVGYEEKSWTPALVREFLLDTFEVEYSRPSCRRLMKEAGLEYRPRTQAGGSKGSEGAGGWVAPE